MCGGGFALLCGQLHLFKLRVGAFIMEQHSWSRIISAQAGLEQDAYVGPACGSYSTERNGRAFQEHEEKESKKENWGFAAIHSFLDSCRKREYSSWISFSLKRWSFSCSLYHSLSFPFMLAALTTTAAQNSYSAHFADAGLQGGNREEIVLKV